MKIEPSKQVKDLRGQKFHHLLVVDYIGRKNGRTMWKCKCDCGNYTEVDSSSLKSGNNKACGCRQSDGWGTNKTHGMSKTKLFHRWAAMKSRCYYKKDQYYKNYGGRGIEVCDEWKNSFEAFRDWALDNGYKDNLSLDRIDNDKGYSPDNCRWATRSEQMNNTRKNHFLEYKGKKQTVAQWSMETGIPYAVLISRINNYGWSVEEALETPAMPKGYRRCK